VTASTAAIAKAAGASGATEEAQPVILPVAGAKRTWSVLGHELGTLRGQTVLALASAVGATGSALVAPWVLGDIVNQVIDHAGTAAIVRDGLILVAAALVSGVLTAVSYRAMTKVGAGVLARLREKVVERALQLPSSTLEKVGTGDLLSRVGDDVAVVTQSLTDTGPMVVSALLTVMFTMAGLMGLDWRLGLAGLCAIPVYVLALRWFLPVSAPFYARERVAMGRRSEAMIASMTGASTVRAYELEDEHLGVIHERSRQAMDISIGVFRLSTRLIGWMNRAETVGLGMILAVGFWLVHGDIVTVGAVTAAALYFHRLFNPLGALMQTFDEIQKSGASLARLVGVADIPVPPQPADPPRPRDTGLVVAGVTHRYDDGPVVVDDVSLEIRPGQRVALVGATGAGKTTLASIIAGLLEPTRGTVRLGGVSLAQMGEARWRSQVALISQDVHVFAGPLVDDVRLAAPGATDEQVAAALERVGASGWVAALPDGLATEVGENAQHLTAAQAQQIALARLLLADPPVVILDEATAEAGSSGAHELEQAGLAATEGRTSLVVAHRLTQAATADLVVVMEHGRVVESGTHDELVAAGGRYAGLWAAWQGRGR